MNAENYTVVTFYKFVDLPRYRELQDPLKDFCIQRNVKGTILLAAEGFNSTLVGTAEKIQEVITYLESLPEVATSDLPKLECHYSQAEFMPFAKMKVKLKKEIVRLGIPEVKVVIDPATHLAWEEWNKILRDPEVTVLDVRNWYETCLGSFEGAIPPDTSTFRQFPEYIKQHLDPKINRKIAMFCTGGVRCEKAAIYMQEQGFPEVYQLKGGILKYLSEVKTEESLWRGSCFVFDDRITIGATEC